MKKVFVFILLVSFSSAFKSKILSATDKQKKLIRKIREANQDPVLKHTLLPELMEQLMNINNQEESNDNKEDDNIFQYEKAYAELNQELNDIKEKLKSLDSAEKDEADINTVRKLLSNLNYKTQVTALDKPNTNDMLAQLNQKRNELKEDLYELIKKTKNSYALIKETDNYPENKDLRDSFINKVNNIINKIDKKLRKIQF